MKSNTQNNNKTACFVHQEVNEHLEGILHVGFMQENNMEIKLQKLEDLYKNLTIGARTGSPLPANTRGTAKG